MTNTEILTLKEASEMLRVPENTLRWWRQQRVGPRSWTLRKRVFYRRADLVAYLDAAYDGESQ